MCPQGGVYVGVLSHDVSDTLYKGCARDLL